jgi:hypothetical protein
MRAIAITIIVPVSPSVVPVSASVASAIGRDSLEGDISGNAIP